MGIEIKRIYEPGQSADGKRILVDRLWPRGMSKERAALDGWMKDAAPSPELRTWFAHQGERFAEFSGRYRFELDTDPVKREAVARLLAMEKEGTVTLLYAAQSPKINHAIVLQKYLLERAAKE